MKSLKALLLSLALVFATLVSPLEAHAGQIPIFGGTVNLTAAQLSDYNLTIQGNIGTGATLIWPSNLSGQWNITNSANATIQIQYSGQATPLPISPTATQLVYGNGTGLFAAAGGSGGGSTGNYVPEDVTSQSALLPAGTLLQRPTTPVAGMLRYNTSTPTLEAYINGIWQSLGLVPDATYSSNHTVVQADMGGYMNLNGNGTLTIPVISSTVFPANAVSCYTNQGSGTWTINSTPTINGLANASVGPGAGGCLVSNGTSLDWQSGISNSGVSAGSYSAANITVNALGQVTAASNGNASSSTFLGTSAGAANPAINGAPGYGLYTADGASKVDVGIAGANMAEWNPSGFFQVAPETITSSSATALTVGQNGSTNPVFAVNASASGQTDGISISGGANGAGVNIAVTGTNTFSTPLTITTLGVGALNLKSGGTISISGAGVSTPSIQVTSNGLLNFSPQKSSTATHITYNNPADTGITAGLEVNEILFGSGGSKQHATGTLALDRDYLFKGATQSFVGASAATDLATIGVIAPICSTNATCTNVSGIIHKSLAVTGTIPNTYGINMEADTGGTNNYAARLVGGSLVDATISATTQSGASYTATSTCGTVTSPIGGVDTGSFLNTTAGTCTMTITFPFSAPNGWACPASDVTTNTIVPMSGYSATTAVIKSAIGAGDRVVFGPCKGF